MSLSTSPKVKTDQTPESPNIQKFEEKTTFAKGGGSNSAGGGASPVCIMSPPARPTRCWSLTLLANGSKSIWCLIYLRGWRNTVGNLVGILSARNTYHGPRFPGVCVKNRGVRFHRVWDFKQYYFNSIPPTRWIFCYLCTESLRARCTSNCNKIVVAIIVIRVSNTNSSLLSVIIETVKTKIRMTHTSDGNCRGGSGGDSNRMPRFLFVDCCLLFARSFVWLTYVGVSVYLIAVLVMLVLECRGLPVARRSWAAPPAAVGPPAAGRPLRNDPWNDILLDIQYPKPNAPSRLLMDWASKTEVGNQWNRNPRPQLEPQINNLDKYNIN